MYVWRFYCFNKCILFPFLIHSYIYEWKLNNLDWLTAGLLKTILYWSEFFFAWIPNTLVGILHLNWFLLHSKKKNEFETPTSPYTQWHLNQIQFTCNNMRFTNVRANAYNDHRQTETSTINRIRWNKKKEICVLFVHVTTKSNSTSVNHLLVIIGVFRFYSFVFMFLISN